MSRQILAKNVSFDEGVAVLRGLFHKYGVHGHNYAMLMQRPDGTLEVEAHPHSPCWGNTRRYKDGTKHRKFDYYPGDLPTPMGPGQPVAAAMPFNLYGAGQKDTQLAIDLVTSVDSPYRKVFEGEYEAINGDGEGGFLFKATDYDPTWQASIFQNLRNYFREKLSLVRALSEQKVHPGLIWWFMCDPHPFGDASFTDNWTTSMHPSWTMKRLINGDPVGLADGTWRQERDYNRPFIHFLFSDYVHPDNYPGSIDVTTDHQEDQHTLNGKWAKRAAEDITTAHTMCRDIFQTLGITDEKSLIAKAKEVEGEVLDRV